MSTSRLKRQSPGSSRCLAALRRLSNPAITYYSSRISSLPNRVRKARRPTLPSLLRWAKLLRMPEHGLSSAIRPRGRCFCLRQGARARRAAAKAWRAVEAVRCAAQVPHPRSALQRRISSAALDADKIINVPKFKSHQQLVATFAVKNMFGVVSARRRPTGISPEERTNINSASCLSYLQISTSCSDNYRRHNGDGRTRPNQRPSAASGVPDCRTRPDGLRNSLRETYRDAAGRFTHFPDGKTNRL